MRTVWHVSTLVGLLATVGFAQNVAFEAASIKPSSSGEEGSSWHSRKGYLVMKNQSLRRLVGIAYGIPPDRVVGGPKWADNDRFDVEARAAGAADDPELLRMLQTLLLERFRLAFHRESKTIDGYALVPGKGGIRVASDNTEGKSSSNSTRGKIAMTRVPMSKLADTLTRFLGSPVIDQTETKAPYSFTIEWTPEPPRSAVPDGALPDPPAGPSLFDVLGEKLGLKLENRKLPVEVIAIDRAERPETN